MYGYSLQFEMRAEAVEMNESISTLAFASTVFTGQHKYYKTALLTVQLMSFSVNKAEPICAHLLVPELDD